MPRERIDGDFCVPSEVAIGPAVVESRPIYSSIDTAGQIAIDWGLARPSSAKPHRRLDIFLPSHSFEESASYLDRPELKRAQVSVLRILKYLRKPRPSSSRLRLRDAEVWRGFEQSLIRYGLEVAKAYVRHGGSTIGLQILQSLVVRGPWEKPEWVYSEDTQYQHQSELLTLGARRAIRKAINHHFTHNGNGLSVTRFLSDHNYPPLIAIDRYLIDDVKHMLHRSYNINFRNYRNHYQQFRWTDERD